MKVMNYLFLIAFVALGGAIGLTTFVIAFNETYIEPLADEEREKYLAMNCEELKKFTTTGTYWSPQNSQEARNLVKNCK